MTKFLEEWNKQKEKFFKMYPVVTEQMNGWFMQLQEEEMKNDVLTGLTNLAVKLDRAKPASYNDIDLAYDIVKAWEVLGMPMVVQEERIAEVIFEEWRDNDWDY